MEKHQINLPESEIQMLIAEYDNKIWKIVKPLQRFETGLELYGRYGDCEQVNFKNRMDDHNFRVGLGTPDCLTDVVYTRKFRNSAVYREL